MKNIILAIATVIIVAGFLALAYGYAFYQYKLCKNEMHGSTMYCLRHAGIL